MSISYDRFINSFLNKISEYDFLTLYEDERNAVVDNYLQKAIQSFNAVSKYDLSSAKNDESRSFNIDIPDSELEEILDIVSEGMVVQWLKPYVYNQEQLQNVLNTRDFTSYSPAELLYRVTGAYKSAQKDFTNMIREYSYRHGDLTVLHL